MGDSLLTLQTVASEASTSTPIIGEKSRMEAAAVGLCAVCRYLRRFRRFAVVMTAVGKQSE